MAEDDNQQILLAHVNKEVIKNARLEEENSRLKKLLAKQTPGNPSSAEDLAASTAEATISASEFRDITDKYDELNKRYKEAAQRIKYLERKNVAVMQKNKDMKESVRAWQDYCDRHIGKQKTKTESKPAQTSEKPISAVPALEPRPVVPSSPMSAAMRSPQSLVGQDRSSPAPMAPLAQVMFPPLSPESGAVHGQASSREQACVDPAIERAAEASPPLPEDTTDSRTPTGPSHPNVAFLGQPSSDKLGSSQTTVDDIAEQNAAFPKPITPEEEDDAPQVVSERSLRRKRKRSTGPGLRGSSDGTPERPIRVKEEMFSSPPLQDPTVQLIRKETMDLDELGPNVIRSPRRLRRTFSIHSNETGNLRDQRSNSAPFSGPLIKMENIAEPSPIADENEAETEAHEEAESRAISEPGYPVQITRDILQPLDPNGPHRANVGTPNKRIKREDARQREAHDILAESGETPPPESKHSKRRPPRLAVAHYNQRVRANNNVGTPSKNYATPKTRSGKQSTAQQPTPPPTMTPSVRPAPRKILPFGTSSDASSTTPSDRRPIGPVWSMAPPSETVRKAPAAPVTRSRKQKPLREKAVAELTVHDFKPNPSYNQGYTHAFSETVRKRADRLCLPGCINPACCGSTFRTLASAAPPLSPSAEEALLQDYLGDAYDSFGLTQMSQEERDEVVLQARTRQMAKEHGKHRQAYEGRKSPPGFWRVGFPSTQEEEEDREKAVQMQQEMVRERWLEAMRGGKWIFRDE
jgi:hypothetical protein